VAYLSSAQLADLGLAEYGEDVLISDRCSLHGTESIHLGSHIRIDDFTVITASLPVIIGSYVHIGAQVFISGMNGFRMGDFAGISTGAAIFTSTDDFSGEFLTGPTVPDRFRNTLDGEVVLGRHVVVCAHTVVMPGVTIPEGSIVGAQSLVVRSLEPWSIYFGRPARFRKLRARVVLDHERLLDRDR